MSQKVTGVDVTRTTTTAIHELGAIVDDPRGGIYAGNRVMYIKANPSVALGVALRFDPAGTATKRNTEVHLTTSPSAVHGIAHVAIAAGSYGWITVEGVVFNAVVPDAATAGTTLGGGAAGALEDIQTTPTAAKNAAAAGGRKVILLEDTGTSLGTVFIS